MNIFNHIKSLLTHRPTARNFQKTTRNNLDELIKEMEETNHALSRYILESRELRWRLQAQRTAIVSGIIGCRQGKSADKQIGTPKELENELIVIDTHLVGLQYQESRLRAILLQLDNKRKLFRYLHATQQPQPGTGAEMASEVRHVPGLSEAETAIKRADARLKDIRNHADATDGVLEKISLDHHLEEDPGLRTFNPQIDDPAAITLFLESEVIS